MALAILDANKNAICPPLGESIPFALPHAISVSLPKWVHNIGYLEGEKSIIDAMKTGYPRFVIHKSIQRLSEICETKFGVPNERCMLFPMNYIASHFRDFMIRHSPDCIQVRLAEWTVRTTGTPVSAFVPEIELHIALFPSDSFRLAKQFWQHAGLGISSRMADAFLAALGEIPSVKNQTLVEAEPPYVEGQCLPMTAESAIIAKRTIRCRIAGLVSNDEAISPSSSKVPLCPAVSTPASGQVSEEDVYLFPSGMAAIWRAHQLLLTAFPPAKSVCFGFPYTDNSKVLEKWGPGCIFFGDSSEASIRELEKLLSAPNAPKVLALFCEFPSNPLLRSVDLRRLREIADRHDFPIIVDETIGNFSNVNVLPFVDIVATSLSKIFSGAANVLGGSLVLNSKGRHYDILKSKLEDIYEDIYWPEDAIHMERNSRNFVQRAHTINSNAEAVCDFLHAQMSSPQSVIKDIFYPKWETREIYDTYKFPVLDGAGCGNFGGLVSLKFKTREAAYAFYDALPCAKGPSLGTNFTLTCPYTVLAHYWELDWAAQYGVDKYLVRISVGMEDKGTLFEWCRSALNAAEAAVDKRSI